MPSKAGWRNDSSEPDAPRARGGYNEPMPAPTHPADVLIIGGGAGGLSCAITLASAQKKKWFEDRRIVIVDDGSSPEKRPIFDALKERCGAAVLRHGVNLGKGAALKTGLLPGAEHVRAAARIAAELAVPAVVDPVLQASGGEPFLDAAGVEALLAELVPLGVILTPNLPEAACLCGLPLEALAVHPEARVDAARRLLERGARAVVLKGGHGREDPVRDLVLEAGAEPWWQVHARIPGASIHGSGCHHAATLAAVLARGGDLREGAREAAGYLAELLVRAVPLGPP